MNLIKKIFGCNCQAEKDVGIKLNIFFKLLELKMSELGNAINDLATSVQAHNAAIDAAITEVLQLIKNGQSNPEAEQLLIAVQESTGQINASTQKMVELTTQVDTVNGDPEQPV